MCGIFILFFITTITTISTIEKKIIVTIAMIADIILGNELEFVEDDELLEADKVITTRINYTCKCVNTYKSYK